MMSCGCQVPPGHGSGKLVVASIALRIPRVPERESCSRVRSEEHTSELQSRLHLVCRLLLEKKKMLINRLEFAVLAIAGIVDQQLDLNSFFLVEGENIFRGILIRQI